MAGLLAVLESGGRSISYFLGTRAIAFAIAAALGSLGFAEIAQWGLRALGATFLTLFAVLLFAALFCWSRLCTLGRVQPDRRVWLEAGLHAANGVATLGLTYTLLGISLGIGTLAEQGLSPETVQPVIRELTRHFSLAFLTTVLGLPTSAALRALLLVTEARLEARQMRGQPSVMGVRP